MDDIFRYAEPVAPRPTIASKIKKPAVGSMRPILPTLGKPAKLPSPIPPDTKTMSEPHPEGVARPVVPKALRAGNPDTLQQRIPRPPKPRYKLQVPMEEAYNRAHDEILGEMNTVSHREDKERYQEAIDDLEKVFVSGSERLMTRFLEDHVGWKTFNHLVQSLKDQETALTSRPGLFARADDDIFRYDAWEDQPRDNAGRWTSHWTTKKHVEAARKKLAKGDLKVEKGEDVSSATGRKIKRWVTLEDGAKIHPDELHRTRFGGDDNEPYVSVNESLDVIDASGRKAERSFATAIKRAAMSKGLTTISGPHGYSATLPGSEWKKIEASGQSFAEWLDDQDADDLKARKKASAEPLTTIGSEKETGDFFSPQSAGQARLFAKEKGQWITIGGHKGSDGKRHGGSPVYIENGRITKGHPGLTGKKIDALGERGEGVSVRAANKQESEYGRSKWAKKARQEGIDPAGLHQLASEVKSHYDAYGNDVRSMVASVKKDYPHLKSALIAHNRGGDSAGIKGIDRISQSVAHSGRYNHLFGGYDAGAFREGESGQVEDYSEKLYEYLTNPPPEPMSEDDAYEQAFEHIKSQAPAVGNDDGAAPFARCPDDMFAYASTEQPDIVKCERGTHFDKGETAMNEENKTKEAAEKKPTTPKKEGYSSIPKLLRILNDRKRAEATEAKRKG